MDERGGERKMPKHLHRDLDELSRELLTMGAMVEEATNKAIAAFLKRDRAQAKAIVEGDATINHKENRIEEQVLKILALHQPVANDLRFLITALKVNNDLERMGDLAANISERTLNVSGLDALPLPDDFGELASCVHEMVRDSLNALVDRDAALARHVCQVDDRVDAINAANYERMQEVIRDDPSTVDRAISVLSISRQLERIADLATNIAEDVVFLVEGEIIRHNL
jgi:phosphate transport system protein